MASFQMSVRQSPHGNVQVSSPNSTFRSPHTSQSRPGEMTSPQHNHYVSAVITGARSPPSFQYRSPAMGAGPPLSIQYTSPDPKQSGQPAPPENLRAVDTASFNVDPDVTYLASQTAADPGRPADDVGASGSGKDFVGGFVVGLKRVFGYRGDSRQNLGHPEEGVVDQNTGYSRSPQTPFHIDPPQSQPQPELVHYASPPPVSETIHGTHEAGDFDERTVVNHDVLPSPPPIGSPVYIEPKPASDYAKMDTPTPTISEASFGKYMTRVQKFFHEINELPWVADHRVTIDYYPGQSRRRRARPRPQRPPIVSWYDRGSSNQRPLDLTASSGPSSPSIQPGGVSYASYAHPADGAVNGVYLMSAVPVDPDGPAPGYPTYPNGYVAFQAPPTTVQMAQTSAVPIDPQLTYYPVPPSQYPYTVSYAPPKQ